METPQQSSNARLAAILGLIAAFIVLIAIVISSLGGGSEGQTRHPAGRQSPAAQKQPPRKVYVVKPGDCCLSQIADKTGIDLETLEKVNPHLDPQAIHSGDRVKLR